MRYGVTAHMMIWWFFVTLITQNTAVTGDPKCITFNNPQPNVKKGGKQVPPKVCYLMSCSSSRGSTGRGKAAKVRLTL